MKHFRTILLWLAVVSMLSGLSAWVISVHLAPRTYMSAFWPCLLWSMVANIAFFTMNGCEGGVVLIVGLGLVIPAFYFAPRLGAPGLPHIALAALLSAFVSSRILYAPLAPKRK